MRHSPATMDSLLTKPAGPAIQQTVLLVGPQPDAPPGLLPLLHSLGAQSQHADSGEQALEILVAEDIALVLADVALPGMDGYALTQWIRENSRTRHIPVILLSNGVWDAAAIARAYEAGAIDYLGRPVAEPVLSSKVAVLLELDGNRRRLRQAISHIDSTKAYYESMLNAAGEGVIGLDRDGHMRFANPAARLMLKVENDQLVGADYRMFYPFPAGDVPHWEHTPFFHTLRHGTETRIEETIFMRHDRTHFPVSLCVSRLAGNGDGLVIVFQDISQRKALEEALRRQAVTDPLTGLNNRSGFKSAFRTALDRARRARKSVALMFIDLDHFKRINDTLGHAAGDFLLAAVATSIRECVRSYDIVSRIGGDEFSVVLDELDDASSAAQIAGKILTALRCPFRLEDGMQVTISASIGIASFPECSDDVDMLMQAAGVAMYQAKSDGRNLYHFYMPEMNAKARHRLMLEQALRVAVEDDGFFLHYQPQVDIGTGRVVGYEALLRWDHDRIGSIAPSTFVPMLEETGLIIPMGQWVFSTGCRQRHAWNSMLPEQCSLSVNLSPRQFADKNLVPQIQRVLEANQLPPYQLEIELTESMLMSNTEHTRNLLRSLKDLGLKLSVDDFGTGYSSLAYLKQFALDALKIDKQFIDHLTTSSKDKAIARSIIQLGHNLGMQVIAEGVETADQVETLQQLGCDVVQGFYFGRPVPAGEVGRIPQAVAVGAQ
jgi:diguanylate cyclase (GGDEF)-like protein/PAS domain S-box-containing protein